MCALLCSSVGIFFYTCFYAQYASLKCITKPKTIFHLAHVELTAIKDKRIIIKVKQKTHSYPV